jgi:hypothetical protein
MLFSDNVDKGEIVAALAGGKHEKRRRVDEFVAVCAAGNARSAAGWARIRRVWGSDPPLWRDTQNPQL